jgi:drug/metabolite transporter (DMT)-like permease
MRKTLSRTRSIFFIHLSNLLFTATAIFISLLSSSFDGYFTSLSRFLIGGLFGFAHLAAAKRPFKIVRFKPWLGRGIFGAVSMTLYYVAIALGTSGRASLFNNTFPIFVALIAIFILRDAVKRATIAGLLLAFSGVAFVLWDGSKVSLMADLAGLSSGILAGASYHFNKAASRTEDPVVIYLSVCFVGILLNAFALPQLIRMDGQSALLLVLAGLSAYFAQIAITVGLRDIPTTEGSVHTFVKIPLTVIAGWFILGDRITARFVAGTCLLVVGLVVNQFGTARRAAATDGTR